MKQDKYNQNNFDDTEVMGAPNSQNSISKDLVGELIGSIDHHKLKIQELESTVKNQYSQILLAARKISAIQEEFLLTIQNFKKIELVFGSRAWFLTNILRKFSKRHNEDLISLSISTRDSFQQISRNIQTTLLETAGQVNKNIPLTIPNRRLKPNQYGFIQTSPIPWICDLFQRPQQMSVAAANLGIPTTYITAFGDRDQPDREITDQFLADPTIFIGTTNNLIAELKNNIISFYSTDLFPFTLLQALRMAGNVLVYEYVDAIDSRISEQAKLMELRHNYLIDPSTVDFVVTTARVLEAEMLERFPRSRVIYLPNAVNDKDFESKSIEHPRSTNLKNWMEKHDKSRKVIGYVGAIAQWLDFDFIYLVAKQHPEIDFVFIGPVYDEFTKEKIAIAPNIEYLGLIPYEDVPAALNQFDICWIPFEDGEIAKSTSPLKLFEYFAVGKPTLTPISMLECSSFSEVFTYDSEDSFKQALMSALEHSNSIEFSERLKSIARENTWSNRVRTLLQHISNSPMS